jgi:hypothetical protein
MSTIGYSPQEVVSQALCREQSDDTHGNDQAAMIVRRRSCGGDSCDSGQDDG